MNRSITAFASGARNGVGTPRTLLAVAGDLGVREWVVAGTIGPIRVSEAILVLVDPSSTLHLELLGRNGAIAVVVDTITELGFVRRSIRIRVVTVSGRRGDSLYRRAPDHRLVDVPPPVSVGICVEQLVGTEGVHPRRLGPRRRSDGFSAPDDEGWGQVERGKR